MLSDHTLPLDREYVEGYLPHRDPMLFIDGVNELSDEHILIQSNIDPKAAYFKGHFPGRPIMPGVLIIETVAQAGALLVSLTRGLSDDKFIAFTNVDAVKFRRPVNPGEVLDIRVEIEKIRKPFYKFIGTARVNGELAATLKFAAAEMSYEK